MIDHARAKKVVNMAQFSPPKTVCLIDQTR